MPEYAGWIPQSNCQTRRSQPKTKMGQTLPKPIKAEAPRSEERNGEDAVPTQFCLWKTCTHKTAPLRCLHPVELLWAGQPLYWYWQADPASWATALVPPKPSHVNLGQAREPACYIQIVRCEKITAELPKPRNHYVATRKPRCACNHCPNQ